MKKRIDIPEFILDKVSSHAGDIVPVAAAHFNISKQRVHHYLNKLIEEGVVIKTGRTSATKYFLASGTIIDFTLPLNGDPLSEDRVWAKYVKPILMKLPENVYKICNYGFTEMYNNAIDHSGGNTIYSRVEIADDIVTITVMDDGIGIFKKIQEALHLDSARESILHLSKGKFTTDPKNHSGQGIFFTSRSFDKLSILSGDLFYNFSDGDWFLSEEKPLDSDEGTFIRMIINTSADTVLKSIFDQYSGKDTGFTKTIVAVRLSQDPNDPHVSRSQAKRLLIGLEKFKTVILDFNGVQSIGQAFVDEIFRVYNNEYPHVVIRYINATADVEEMINRGIADSKAM